MQLWSANPGALPRNLVVRHQGTGNVSSRQVFEATLFIFAHLEPKAGLPEDNSNVNHHHHIKTLSLLNAVYQRLRQTPQGKV